MWIASICWIVAGLFYLLIACNWKSLRVSIAVIETAAEYFADTKRIIFIPLIYFAVWVCVFIFWAWGLAGVASISATGVQYTNIALQLRTADRTEGTNWMIAGMFFGMVWISAFIIAMNEFVIICSSATWYFSRKDIPDGDGIPGDSDVWKGMWWSFRYNMGSIALGSGILAIVWAIRAIFEYIGNKMYKASGNNGCTKCLIGSISCCLDCFDRFIRYLNRNAYIYMAISGESFCPSALHSFLLILKNASKFAFVEGLSDVFMFLAKFFIAITTTVVGYYLMTPMTKIKIDPTIPCVIIFFFAYFVACKFIGIFDTSANTILQCYLFDLDLAKHHNLEMRHVPETLQKFLNMHGAASLNVKGAETSDEKQNLMT